MISRATTWIFLLIYAITQGKSQRVFRYQCPSGCSCIPDDTELLLISCRWQTITRFIEPFPRNVTKSLTIQCSQSNSEESELTNGTFSGFYQLRELKISNCKINLLKVGIFDDLQNIRGLHLFNISGQSLILKEKVLAPMKFLERLTIVNSRIEAIEKGSLCSLKNLQILNMTRNRLYDFEISGSDSDCMLKHLIICDLSMNRIRQLKASQLNILPSVMRLKLDSNNLKSIDSDAFKKTNLIQHLELHNNDLVEMVPIPDSITHINLAHNQLTTIPASVANLLSLVSLNVSGNSIDSTTPFSLLSTSIEILDLSNNKLSDIPLKLFRESVNTITTLIMAQNNVSEIQPQFLQNFTHLKELDLSKNQIRKMPHGMFDGLNELIHLQMNDNFVHHVDMEVFNNLDKQLTSLNLANNMLVELPMAIGRLSKIKEINLSGNKITTMYKFVLNKIHHLEKLDLSYNQLTEIESYVFSDSIHLTQLNLTGNKISSIDDDAFAKCPNLRIIDLAKNHLQDLKKYFKSLSSLHVLNVSNNELEVLDYDTLPSQLIELYANNNAIRHIEKAPESNLKIIHLHKNRLQTIEADQLPTLLEDIDIGDNELQQISRYSFEGKSRLRSINIQHNQLKTIPQNIFDSSETINTNLPGRLFIRNNPLICNCEMAWIANITAKQTSIEVIDIEDSNCTLPLTNQITTIQSVSEDEYLCRYNKICEPGCICCQYKSCDCRSTCPDNCSCFRDNQYKVNIVKCESKMGDKTSIRAFPMYASHIYLTNANIPILRSHDLMGRNRLTQLHITSSGLHTIEPLALNTLPKLRILDLSSNNLQKINGDESFKTQRIHKLNVENNNITEIDERLAEIMPNLEILYAANNAMKTLPKYLMADTIRDRLKSISLGNNPFRCDCSSTRRFQMQEWFTPNKDRILDAQNIYCVENITESLLLNDSTVLTTFAPNMNSELFTMPITDFLYHENRSLCIMKAEGFFGGTTTQNILLTSFIVVIMISIITGLLYVLLSSVKNKADKTYSSQTRFKMNSVTLSADQTQGYSPLPSEITNYFDVFVSYSKEDEYIVLNELCRPLEARFSSVFLLHRDGKFNYNEGWQSISDELNHQVQACQTLIMYITKRFLEKEWKTVQIKMAHYLFARSTDKKLIAIISEEVDPNELSLELGKILRKQTIIQRKNPLYWHLLESEISSSRPSNDSETSQTYSGTYDCIVPSEIV